MICLIFGLLITLSLIILALATWIEVSPKGRKSTVILKPNAKSPKWDSTRLNGDRDKKSCGNCQSCKCNTTKSSDPR